MTEIHSAEGNMGTVRLPAQVAAFGGAREVDITSSQINNVAGNYVVQVSETDRGGGGIYQHLPRATTDQEVTNDTANFEECDSEVYARLLFAKRRGFPMWSPRLDENLPRDYLDTGIRIGDVGIITSNGDFDFLFNICLPSDHPINGNSVPEGFKILELPPENRNVAVTKSDDPGALISNGVTFDFREVQSSLKYNLTATKDSGALLILPEGSSQEDLRNLTVFRNYACLHGEAWYRYANGPLGREAPHNSIHLVTGHDKCNSWLLGAFSWKRERLSDSALSMEFISEKVVDQSEDELRYGYHWSRRCPINTKYGSISPIPVSSVENQCIFVRTFNVALNIGIWYRLFKAGGNIKISSSQYLPIKSYFPRPYQGHSLLSGWTPTSDTTKTSDKNKTSSGHEEPTAIAIRDVDRYSKFVHPSHILNEYIFQKKPDTLIAVSHDREWECLLQDKDEDNIPGQMEMFERIQQVYAISVENAVGSNCAFLKPTESSKESSKSFRDAFNWKIHDSSSALRPTESSKKTSNETPGDDFMMPNSNSPSLNPRVNYRHNLYNLCQNFGLVVKYETLMEGPQHNPTWYATCYVNGTLYGQGAGRSKGDANEVAASKALVALSAIYK